MRLNKKFFETKDFKKLNREWQRKLKETGFDEMESQSNMDNNSVTKQEFKIDPAWVAYNHKCQIFLNSGSISDKIDLFIFTQHCEGISNVEISKALPDKGFPTLDRRSVDRRLLKLLKQANIEPIDFGSN